MGIFQRIATIAVYDIFGNAKSSRSWGEQQSENTQASGPQNELLYLLS